MQSAVIVIDTGFSTESLLTAKQIIAVLDLSTGRVHAGEPYLTFEQNGDILRSFAGDPLNHGSLVLKRLMEVAPALPVVLVRAYDNDVRLIRSGFSGGEIVRPGWTEAYVMAVKLCAERGLSTVANLSFGGYTHAMDGSGWESHCLAQVTGVGKPGHIVLAGAGAGNGRAIHASWSTQPGTSTVASAQQNSDTTYNLWCAAPAEHKQAGDWVLEVLLDGKPVLKHSGAQVLANLWNKRKQLTFTVPGKGLVTIRTSRFWQSDTAAGAFEQRGVKTFARRTAATRAGVSQLGAVSQNNADNMRFDCWINHQDDAVFLDNVDERTIAEPAVFPHVIAVGLRAGKYAPDQEDLGAKPDVLLNGQGPISFRLPEVVALVASLLNENPSLDVAAVKNHLAKFPAE